MSETSDDSILPIDDTTVHLLNGEIPLLLLTPLHKVSKH